MRKRLETMIVLLVAIAVVVAVLLLPFGLALAAPDGKALYDQKCAMCHGGNGVAKEMWAKKGMKNLNDDAWQKANTDEAIAKVDLGRQPRPQHARLQGQAVRGGDRLRGEAYPLVRSREAITSQPPPSYPGRVRSPGGFGPGFFSGVFFA